MKRMRKRDETRKNGKENCLCFTTASKQVARCGKHLVLCSTIAGTSISISSSCMACLLMLVSCVAGMRVAYKCDASWKIWSCFTPKKDCCAPHIQAPPSEEVFDRRIGRIGRIGKTNTRVRNHVFFSPVKLLS
jgi:hypothetical protein